MTLDDITHEIGDLSVRSIAQDSDYISLINRAQRSICQRNSWSWMHQQRKANVLAGETSVALDPTFKALTEEESPVSYTDASFGNSDVPVKVASRQEIESWFPWPWPWGPILVPIPGSYLPIRVVFIEFDGGDGLWKLHIPRQFAPTATLVFNISAYWFPNNLVLGTDSNPLTNSGDLAEALINRAKALAYFAEDPTDKRGIACQQMYQDLYKSALYADTAQRFAGRVLHM